MPLKPFQFKEFTIHQNHSVLKVGTDAMVLGAYVRAEDPATVLDIGTGTGVLSLMMAQKFANAQITAIDLDFETLIDCQQNFEESRWSKRMKCFHHDFSSFLAHYKFDLIICNPPFYEKSLKSKNERVNHAKHSEENFLHILFSKTAELLASNGVFWIILPYDNFQFWKTFAKSQHLFIQEEILVQSKIGIPKRIIASFSFVENFNPSVQNFVIRTLDNSYTKEYIQLTKLFHSKNL